MSDPDIRKRFIRPSLDPQKLSHFLAVYDSGNFSSAAKANNVSQQAVSKSIGKLEGALGVKLFERSSFGAEATIFGHALARRAKVITAESRLAGLLQPSLRRCEEPTKGMSASGWAGLSCRASPRPSSKNSDNANPVYRFQ